MGRELLPQFGRHSRCCLLSYIGPGTWFVKLLFEAYLVLYVWTSVA